MEYKKKTACMGMTGLLFLCAASLALSSCDGAIYDGESIRTVAYRAAFRYDDNMAWADAFPSAVKDVRLYAFGADSVLAWQGSEEGDALACPGYSMKLGLPPGGYRLLAWCGTGDGGQDGATVPEARIGETRLGEMLCRISRSHDGETAYRDTELRPFFHGMADVTLPILACEGGERTFTVPLVKNSNHVRVILQHLSGHEVNPGDFTFRIEEENGLMDWDNTLLPDETISYRPYSVKAGTASMGIDDYPAAGTDTAGRAASRAITSVSVAIADFSVGRLTAGRHTYLTVYRKEGDIAARIPLTDYALLLKDGYAHGMTDQEYLDRQDEYALTFFLDEDRYWISSAIIINSWKIALDDVDFDF